jgi:hypothetical protein
MFILIRETLYIWWKRKTIREKSRNVFFLVRKRKEKKRKERKTCREYDMM